MNDIAIAAGLGVVLSIDCLFVIMLYSYCNAKDKRIYMIPVLIGIFHILLPLISYTLVQVFHAQIGEQTWIPALAFLYLGLKQIFEKEEDKSDHPADCPCCQESKKSHLFAIILLCLSVSLDSLFMGMSLGFTTKNIYLYAPIFGVVAFAISGVAVYIGTRISKVIDVDLSKVCGFVFIGLAFLFYFGIL